MTCGKEWGLRLYRRLALQRVYAEAEALPASAWHRMLNYDVCAGITGS